MYSSIYGDLPVKTESSVKIKGKDIMPFDACGIIGLNQESSINAGFERCSLFSLTLKQQKIYFSVINIIIALTEKNAEFMGEIICLCAIIFGETKIDYTRRKL